MDVSAKQLFVFVVHIFLYVDAGGFAPHHLKRYAVETVACRTTVAGKSDLRKTRLVTNQISFDDG
jgi:hypothetical protein